MVKYGENYLTYEDVLSQIPSGIMPEDSASLFHAIIKGWITDNVLAEIAEKKMYDVGSIERRVNDYRNTLIVREYLNRLKASYQPKIDESRIREYYDKHHRELKLEVPLIKGILLKVNSDAKGKENIKNLLSSKNPEIIDKLEQQWLDKALEYKYFRDKWVDWDTMVGMIPYRFENPDVFVKENIYFETEYEDCSYYLQISDYILTGEEQPYDYAKTWIESILTQGDINEYEKNIVEAEIKKAIENKKLETIGYDPLRHEVKEKKR